MSEPAPSPVSDSTLAKLLDSVEKLRAEVAAIRSAVDRIDSQLGTVTGPENGRDRRRHPRSKVQTSVTVLSDRHPGHALPGVIVDCSAGGVAVVLDSLIPLGSYVTFLPVSQSEAGHSLEARVTNRMAIEGRWRLGCEFLRRPTPEERAAYGFPATDSELGEGSRLST